MKLSVFHRTQYEYASPVKESFNEARLQPISNAQQDCESFELKVFPNAKVSSYSDFHANLLHYFELFEPHSTLVVEGFSKVSTMPILTSLDATPASMELRPQCQRMERCFDFLQDSTYIEKSPEAWRLALDITAGIDDMWQAAIAIMRHVHANFTYAPLTTSVNTHMRDVLRDRRGVCQDLAHVMIGLCRAIGIPALYVSGYLYNGPRDQLIGAQASHAWCEIFLPGTGWRGLDPTNNQLTDERYIKLAVGGDYADVPPLRGHYKGTKDRVMTVEVLVESL